MSNGYYTVRVDVFHNREEREKFLEMNHFHYAINRKETRQLCKKLKIEKTNCESCTENHGILSVCAIKERAKYLTIDELGITQ